MKHINQPVAIVTGAGSGIGRVVAVGLGTQGYRVVLVGRRVEQLEQTGDLLDGQGAEWLVIAGDVALTRDRETICSQTLTRFGQVDVIVNNAGLGTCKKLGELSELEVSDLFAVNAIGPIELVRLVLPELIESNGCVVNVASMAIVDPFVGLGIYGCAKAALDGLTRSLHNEYGVRGVRAFTVAPGAVETEMLRSIVAVDILPTEQTLSPEKVAAKVISCINGEIEESSGSTILLQSPS